MLPPPRSIPPVLNKLKQSYKIWQDIFPHLSKVHRQTIGVKIDKLLLDTLELVFKASYSSGISKIDLLTSAIDYNDLAKFFVVVSWECKIIDDKKNIRISQSLVDIGKELFNWRESLKNKNPSGHASSGENS
jgi:hypothetical protein